MTQSRQCPKCAGALSDGFIVDKTHGGAAVASWVEGDPKKSIWVGLKLGGTTPIEVTTWRCRRCGYLEASRPTTDWNNPPEAERHGQGRAPSSA